MIVWCLLFFLTTSSFNQEFASKYFRYSITPTGLRQYKVYKMWKRIQKVDWKNFIFDLRWNKNFLLIVAEPIEDLTWALMFYWNYWTSLGKEIKCEACWAFYLFFRNEFNKFNNTRARMLDSIYYMTLNILWNLISAVKRVILSLCTQRCYGRHNSSRKSVYHLWYSILMQGVISLLDAASYDKR